MNIIDWQETKLQDMQSARSELQVFSILAKICAEIGFEFCSYRMRMPLPLVDPHLLEINNFSNAWQLRYCQKNYAKIDPTVRHGMKTVLPLVWCERFFEANRAFWDDAHAHGLRFGWTQSCYGASGVGGVLSLVRSENELGAKELLENGVKMQWLVHAAHEGFSSLLLERSLPHGAKELTLREIDVLKWSADGKTANEVGEILHISERTANFHITNALTKLGAANKTAGVIKAALLRLL